MKKAVAVLAAIYLLAGAPMLVGTLEAPPIFQTAAMIHLACTGIGVLGCIAALAGKQRLARWLVLPAMAVASLVVAWPPDRWIVYPSFLTVPLTVFLRQGDGTTYRLGVNALPAALLIALSFALRSPPRPPREEPVDAVGADERTSDESP